MNYTVNDKKMIRKIVFWFIFYLDLLFKNAIIFVWMLLPVPLSSNCKLAVRF